MRAPASILSCTLLLPCGWACGGDDEPADGTQTVSTDGGSTSDAATSGGGLTDATGTSAPTTTGDSTTASPTDGADETTGAPSGGTPGCGLPVGTGAGTVEIDVGGTMREFLLVVPDGYDPDTPSPLVFAFHGLGGSSELARLYFGVEGAADGEAIFVYPQGVPQAFVGGQTGWDLTSAGPDVDFFDAMVAELSAGACLDPDRIFATGHSFGGYMSNALGCFRPQVLRAIAPVAGGPPLGGCQDSTVAAWLAHGMGDEVVAFSQGELARDSLLDRNGCETTTTAVEPAPCVAYDGCEADVPVVWCAHDDPVMQGHAWPRFAGPAIWAFFDALAPKG